jgi:hypothetical protein
MILRLFLDPQDFLRGLGGFAGALHAKYRRIEIANSKLLTIAVSAKFVQSPLSPFLCAYDCDPEKKRGNIWFFNCCVLIVF